MSQPPARRAGTPGRAFFRATLRHARPVMAANAGALALLLLAGGFAGFFPALKSDLEAGVIESASEALRSPGSSPGTGGSGIDFGRVVQRFREGPRDGDDWFTRLTRPALQGLTVGGAIGAYAAITLVLLLVELGATMLRTRLVQAFRVRIRSAGVEKALVVDPLRHGDVANVPGQYAASIQSGANAISDSHGLMLDVGSELLILGITFIVLFGTSVPFGLACLAVVMAHVVLSRFQARRLEGRRAELDRTRNVLQAETDEIISKREIIQAHEQQERYGGRLREMTERFSLIIRALDRREALFEGGRSLIRDFGQLLVLLIPLGLVAVNPSVTGKVGDIYFLLVMYARVITPTRRLMERYDEVQRSAAKSATFLELLDAEPPPRAPVSLVSPLEPAPGAAGAGPGPRPDVAVEFREVTFGYSPSRAVLDRCSFLVPDHATTLIVGRSGSGKSTLVRLLLGFRRDYQGLLFVKGREARAYELTELHALMSFVSQLDQIADDSIEGNLQWAWRADGRPVAEDQMLAALEAVGLEPGAGVDPRAYLASRALTLSFGQQQRLSVARLMLDESPVVILDEPLAGVDGFTFRELWPALRNQLDRPGRTSILFSHRLAFASAADHVVVLGERGAIVEQGAPRALLASPGAFKELHDAAARELALIAREGAPS